MKRTTLILTLFFIAGAALAQDVKTTPQPKPTLKEITLESIFDPKQRVAFSGAPQSGFVWLDDKTFTWPRTNEQGDVVEQVVRSLEFSVLAKYAFGLAQMFNAFYHRYPILNEERADLKRWRAAAVAYVRDELTRALGLMGIEVPARM